MVEEVPFPGQGPGLEGLKETLSHIRCAFPDSTWTVEEQIAEGDKVLSRFVWSGTIKASSSAFRRRTADTRVGHGDRPLCWREDRLDSNPDGHVRHDDAAGGHSESAQQATSTSTDEHVEQLSSIGLALTSLGDPTGDGVDGRGRRRRWMASSAGTGVTATADLCRRDSPCPS